MTAPPGPTVRPTVTPYDPHRDRGLVVDNDQIYVYEHIFGRGAIRLLRLVRIPIFLAAAYLAWAILRVLASLI